MERDSFGLHKIKGKPHHQLGLLVGEWEGMTRTWFYPGVLADESPTHGTMHQILDGRFVYHEYHGSLDGKPLAGIAIYGFNLGVEAYEMIWLDTYHMGTGMMYLHGERAAEGFSVLGSYDDPSGGPPWGWRNKIEIINPDRIRISAYNIPPGGEEAKAIGTIYHRKK